MIWRRLVFSLFLISGVAHSEPAIIFGCIGGDTDRRQECSLSIDRERIEKAFEPVEKEAQGVKSPSEAMNLMANAMTVFASLLKEQ